MHIESRFDARPSKHTANVENASELTIDETEYKAVCKWMYEREKERKTEDSPDYKETRDAVMIVGGRRGRRRELQKRVRNEIETHRIAI